MSNDRRFDDYDDADHIPRRRRLLEDDNRGASQGRYDDADDFDDQRLGRSYAPHRGVMIIVLSIVSFSVCPLIAIVSWMMAKNDLREIEAGRMDREGHSLTQAGKIISLIVLLINGIIYAITAAILALMFMLR